MVLSTTGEVPFVLIWKTVIRDAALIQFLPIVTRVEDPLSLLYNSSTFFGNA